MNNKPISRSLRVITALLLLVSTLVGVSASADEPRETIQAPGFRLESEHAAAFLEAMGGMSIDVLPTMVHRAGRTGHSFDSQQMIADFLNANQIAIATQRPYRVDLGMLERRSQWDLFQRGMAAIALRISKYQTEANYTLVMEVLVPGDQEVFGIHVFILDKQGRNAFSFLLNAHHRLFAEAKLAASGTSEAARETMIANATHTGLMALQAQIEDARECAQRVSVNVPKILAGILHHFDGGLTTGSDKWGNPLGYSTFNGPDSRVGFATTKSYPSRAGADTGNGVLRLDFNVTSWGGIINRFTNETADQWTAQDWRDLDALSFWFRGENSGTEVFFHLFDNRHACSRTDDAERFGYRFWDDVAGWRLITVRIADLARQNVGNDAPNDGLGLARVHGWGIGTMNTKGPVTFFIDDMRVLSETTDKTAQAPGPTSHKLFIETRLSENLSRIETSTRRDGSLAVERIMGLACECTRLAMERGFGFFRMDERELLSNERARFRLTFYESRPSDMPVQEIPDNLRAEDFVVNMSAAIPVEEFRRACELHW